MYPYIICPTCSCSLGELYLAFQDRKEKRIKKYYEGKEVDPKKYDVDPDAHIEFGEDLDALHIDNICCRMRMLTQVMLYDVIYAHLKADV
jgi:DNA-directed RNA polymerase subunit N (RpoN/RPB10)